MKKLLFPLLLLAMLTGTSCEEGETNANKSGVEKPFTIVLAETNEVVFDENDIKEYDPTKHKFYLTESGVTKLKSYQPDENGEGGYYQDAFIVKLGETIIYDGFFWSALSSRSVDDIVITDMFILNEAEPALTAADSYPGSDDGLTSELDDERLAQRFKEINKLNTEASNQ